MQYITERMQIRIIVFLFLKAPHHPICYHNKRSVIGTDCDSAGILLKQSRFHQPLPLGEVPPKAAERGTGSRRLRAMPYRYRVTLSVSFADSSPKGRAWKLPEKCRVFAGSFVINATCSAGTPRRAFPTFAVYGSSATMATPADAPRRLAPASIMAMASA